MTRHIGFVGFKTEEEAKAALEFFNNTYLDTSKLQVELAEAVMPVRQTAMPEGLRNLPTAE